MKHIISLGAGVQSSTMALMAAAGEIEPMPDCAIFADTQWEPRKVYAWLDWLEQQLPFPVYRVTAGNIYEDMKIARTSGGRWASMPLFVKNTDTGEEGMIRRQCTKEYKLEPLKKKVRELAGVPVRARPKEILVAQWIGISLDEINRVREADLRWIKNRYPLIELGMSRGDCLLWMERKGYPQPPKSACKGCPYNTDEQFALLKRESPEEWEEVVEFDRIIRRAAGMRFDSYLHRSCVPIDEVILGADEAGQLDLLSYTCEGMCGM